MKTIVKFRNVLAAAVLVGSLLATTACTANNPEPAAPAATESTISPAAPVEKETPAETAPAEGADLIGTHGLAIKGLAENEHGQYLQIALPDNDPSLEYKPELVTAEVTSKFSPEKIKEAQKFAMTFTAEEMFDSTLNGGFENDKWFAKNGQKIAPELRESLVAHARANKDFVNRSSWGAENSGKYTYAYDKDSTRILGYEIRLTEVRNTPEDLRSIGFHFDYDYNIVAQNIETSKTFPMHVTGKGRLYVREDESNPGNWMITGFKTDYEGSAATENLK